MRVDEPLWVLIAAASATIIAFELSPSEHWFYNQYISIICIAYEYLITMATVHYDGIHYIFVMWDQPAKQAY